MLKLVAKSCSEDPKPAPTGQHYRVTSQGDLSGEQFRFSQRNYSSVLLNGIIVPFFSTELTYKLLFFNKKSPAGNPELINVSFFAWCLTTELYQTHLFLKNNNNLFLYNLFFHL